MKELSLNILDIVENSVKARAANIGIDLDEREKGRLVLTITDNGCGMEDHILRRVTDPFYTTRTTRPVGMGLSLLKLAAEQTGGTMTVESVSEKVSPDKHGTVVRAEFFTDHIDCVPLGDVTSTLVTLIQGSPDIDFHYTHRIGENTVELDTVQLRTVLEDVPLNSFEVLQWIESFVNEQYAEIHNQ